MDLREKLVALLNEVQNTGVIDTPAGFGSYYDWIPNKKVAQHLIENGVTVSEGALPVAEEATERSAAVNKIEEKRKPDDFIGNRKPGQEWIPVTERLPDAEDVFLCWSKDLSDMMFCYTSDFKQMEVTHWMPLPEPPKEE